MVTAIMALIGAYVLSNYADFGEGQKLQRAVADTKGLLRQAQSNATANVKCHNSYSAVWQVVYENSKTLELRCQERDVPTGSFLKKSLVFERDITMSLSGEGCQIGADDAPVISFKPLSGQITFSPPLGSSESSCLALIFELTNSESNDTKSLKIEKKGGIYEQQ